MAGATLQILGGFSLRRPDGRDGAPGPRKSRALLGYLALNPAGATRDRLAGLLWSDAPAAQARVSVRQCLSAVRRGLGDVAKAWIDSDGDRVVLSAPDLRIDALEVLRTDPTAELDALERAIAAYRGPLLEGICADEAPFEHWRSAEQQSIRHALERLVVSAVERRRVAGEEQAALRLCLGLVNVDWTNEAAHRLVMESYARTGQLATARAQFQRLREQLEASLGTQPSPATVEVYRNLGRIAAASRPAPQREGRADPPAVEQQRRQVCAWFVGAPDTDTHSPEAQHAELALLWEAARSVAADHRADETHASADGLLALWGTKHARADQAERAVAAARILQTRLADNDVVRAPAIGIASGLVVPAPGLAPPWVGGAINQARRLAAQTEAAGVAMCPETRDSLRADAPRAPLVGRDMELTQLQAFVEGAASHSKGAIVVLRGEAGVGKTRLCEELARHAEDQALQVVRLHVSSSGEGDQHDLLRALARRLCALLEPASDDAESQGSVLGPEREPQLRALLGLPLDPRTRAVESASDGERREQQRRQTVLALLQAVVDRGPLVWILEDIHWAPAEELQRLADVLDSVKTRPIVCVLTIRIEDEPDREDWKAAVTRRGVAALAVEPLGREAALELAIRLGDLPPAAARSVADRAGGNPLFLEQLVRRARDGGTSSEIPSTVQAIVVGRLDRQPAETRESVELAAVIGQRVKRETLDGLIGAEHVRRLREDGWIEADGAELRFVHALVRDAVYSAIHADRRNDLHARVAHHYEGRDNARRAEHLAAAGDPLAAEAFLAAAREAAADARISAALALIARGREVEAASEVAWELASRAGDLYRQLGRRTEAMAAYAAAREHATTAEQRLAVLLGEAETLNMAERLEEALQRLDEASRILDLEPSDLWMSRVATLRGNFHFPSGNYAACAGAHGHALILARRAGSVADEARALMGLADAEYLRANVERAAELFTEVADLCREHDLLRHEAAARSMAGFSLVYVHRFEEAESELRAAVERAVLLGARRIENVARSGLAVLHLARGESHDAEREAEITLQIVREFEGKRFEPLVVGYLTQARLQRGETDGSHAALLEAAERCAGSAERFWRPGVLATLAATSTDRAARTRYIEEGLAFNVGCPFPARVAFYPIAIQTALADHEWDLVERLAESYEAYATEHPFAQARYVVARARLLAARGRNPDADVTEELRALHDEALAVGLGDPSLLIPAAPEESKSVAGVPSDRTDRQEPP